MPTAILSLNPPLRSLPSSSSLVACRCYNPPLSFLFLPSSSLPTACHHCQSSAPPLLPSRAIVSHPLSSIAHDPSASPASSSIVQQKQSNLYFYHSRRLHLLSASSTEGSSSLFSLIVGSTTSTIACFFSTVDISIFVITNCERRRESTMFSCLLL
ncbi:hypothetical protein BHE74_00050562 [Ensete ventricosum]|nr:hypothetical protein GW17_00028146 [Ensete ventricosum]RWW43743.1 hypothetical protein BHE74_00050562 [Ensete ventricosum]